MNIKWLGHASFLITAEDGTRIITDPYWSGIRAKLVGLMYPKIREAADIVTVSHNHPDHNNVATISGNPHVIREVGTTVVNGITFKGVNGSHGKLRGSNIMYCFTVDGVKCCHLGDIVEALTEDQLSEIGDVDVLFLPLIRLPFVRRFNHHPAKPKEVTRRLTPNVIIPMHFRNWRCWMPFPTINRYLQSKTRYQILQSSELQLRPESLPTPTEIMVLHSS